MFSFINQITSDGHPNTDGMIKYGIIQARQSNATRILVSREWFDACKSTLASIVHPASVTDESAVLPTHFGVLFQVDKAITNKFDFKVE